MYVYDVVGYNLDFLQYLNLIFPIFFIIGYYFISKRTDNNKWKFIFIYFINISIYEAFGWAYFYFINRSPIVFLMYIFIGMAALTLLIYSFKPSAINSRRNISLLLLSGFLIFAALGFTGYNVMILIISAFVLFASFTFIARVLRCYDLHNLNKADKVELWLFFTIFILNLMLILSSNRLLSILHINYYIFFLKTGISQYLLRIIIYLLLFAELLILYLKITGRTFTGKPLRAYSFFLYLNIVFFVFVTVSGFLLVNISSDSAEKQKKITLLAKAETAAAAILPASIEELEADSFSLESVHFNELRNVLNYIQVKNPDIRFAYIYRIKNKRMQFIVDSEPDSSLDFIAPGTMDTMELDSSAIADFSNGISAVEGPFFDEWGEWITASAPIRDDKNNIIAAIGMDTDAYFWAHEVILSRHVPLVIIILIDILYFYALVTILVLRRSYMELAMSELKYRSLFEKSKNSIFILSLDGTIMDANIQAKHMLKMEGNNISGESFERFLSRTSNVDYYNIFINYISYAKSLPINVNMVDSIGTVIPAEISAFNVSIDSRKVIFVIVNNLSRIKEIEREKSKLEEQLHQMEKMDALGYMAGGIAHDFNNILTIVLGNAELIASKSEGIVREYAQKIAGASDRAKKLTAELLSFARKAQYQIVPINMKTLIEDSLHLLKSSMGKDIRIHSSLNVKKPYVMGDISQLQNVIFNIAINARDAMPDGGIFTIAMENTTINSPECNEQLFIKISFKDTGVGMDNELQKHIFEPFFTTKEMGRGTGLGLSSVFGAVQKHGGFIEVHSNPSKGSIFEIYLPSGNIDSRDAKKRNLKDYNTQSYTVLFVDDEEYIRTLALEFLKPPNEVILQKNGTEAVEYYKKHYKEIDIVILDMIMPGMNGINTFRHMKAVNPQIKAIIISGYSINKDINRFTDEGIISFVQKPFGKKELLDIIQSGLQQF